jgi:hypothetical protein
MKVGSNRDGDRRACASRKPMKHPTSRMLFSYWDGLRGQRAAPERGEIEPGEIRHILADTFILEIGPDRRAAFRLGGTRLCALFGRELKGEPFDALWPAEAQAEMRHFIDIVLDETAGLVVGLVGARDDDVTLDLEMVLLPLRHRGKTQARLIGALSPAAVPAWIGYHPLTHLKTVSHRVIWPSGRPMPRSLSDEPTEQRQRLVLHPGGRQ